MITNLQFEVFLKVMLFLSLVIILLLAIIIRYLYLTRKEKREETDDEIEKML